MKKAGWMLFWMFLFLLAANRDLHPNDKDDSPCFTFDDWRKGYVFHMRETKDKFMLAFADNKVIREGADKWPDSFWFKYDFIQFDEDSVYLYPLGFGAAPQIERWAWPRREPMKKKK